MSDPNDPYRSDPNDPYRFIPSGPGSELNLFGESISDLREEFEKITNVDIINEFKNIRKEFERLMNSMKRNTTPIKDLEKSFREGKLAKGSKDANKLFKELKSVGKELGKTSNTLKPMSDAIRIFSDVLRSLEPLIGMSSSLFSSLRTDIYNNLSSMYEDMDEMFPETESPFIELEESELENFNILDDVEYLGKSFDQLSIKMEEGSEIIKKLGLVIGDRKTEKGLKKGTIFFKSMKGAGSIFNDLIQSLSPMSIALKVLSTILDSLKPLLDMVNALFSVMGAGITKALVPVIEKFAKMMPELIPIFMEIGQLIGEVIAIALIPLLDIFKLIMPVILQIAEMILPVIAELLEGLMPIIVDVIEEILPIILDIFKLFRPILSPLIDILLMVIQVGLVPLRVILDIIRPILVALNPLFKALGVILEDMEPVINIVGQVLTWLIKFAFIPLVGAIYGIGLVIAGMIDFFSAGTAKAVKGWESMMGPMLESLIEAPEWGELGGELGFETYGREETERTTEKPSKVIVETLEGEESVGSVIIKEGMITGMQKGGIVLSEGIYKLGEKNKPEIVQPLEHWEKMQADQTLLLENIHTEISQLTEYNRRLLIEKEFKYAFEGL